MKVCILNFSGREYGNCKHIADFINEKFIGNEVIQFDFNNLNITPCGKCKAECFKNRVYCPYLSDKVYNIYDSVTNSDCAYFIVPNYCDYPCANFFIFNERSQCYFQGREDLLEKYLKIPKSFIVVSNTEKLNFLKAFEYQCEEGKTPNILFLSAKKYCKVSIDGDITESNEALSEIVKFINNKKV